MQTSWIYLFIAALFEIGWPLGFKLSQTTGHKIIWIVFAAISMTLSGIFLWLAQRTIPVGTAYAVWTGIGAAGTFILGIVLFKDAASMMKILSVLLIIAGVIGLRLSHG
jgi:quaternary ammonium compound-resistance protein SugE